MPTLYHFTCRDNIEGIFRTGMIRPGKAVIPPTELSPDYAVCLTSDHNPDGHGLPDGREVSWEDANHLGCFSQNGDKLFSVDFTKYRIKIAIPDGDSNLIYLPSLFSSYPSQLLAMEVAAHFPCTVLSSQESILNGFHLLQTGQLKGKADTWWYYLGNIPLNWFVEVGLKIDENQYLSEDPYIFQRLLVESSQLE